MATPETTGAKQSGRYRKGQSGNPTGRPLGARHRATVAAETLLDGEAEALTRKAIELALAGDTVALRLCIDRVIPPRRERPICFRMPSLQVAGDAAIAMDLITAAMAAGELTSGEAGEFIKIVSAFVEALAATDFERRLSVLEEAARRHAA